GRSQHADDAPPVDAVVRLVVRFGHRRRASDDDPGTGDHQDDRHDQREEARPGVGEGSDAFLHREHSVAEPEKQQDGRRDGVAVEPLAKPVHRAHPTDLRMSAASADLSVSRDLAVAPSCPLTTKPSLREAAVNLSLLTAFVSVSVSFFWIALGRPGGAITTL